MVDMWEPQSSLLVGVVVVGFVWAVLWVEGIIASALYLSRYNASEWFGLFCDLEVPDSLGIWLIELVIWMSLSC